jgi:GNAT superfamily N-acetyltransferase
MKKYIIAIWVGISSMVSAQNSDYTIKLLVGDQMQEMLPVLADWRFTYFHGYPYLYDGMANSESIERERNYGKDLMKYAHSAIAVAYLDDKPVGLLSGASLVDFCGHFGDADGFRAIDVDPITLYYFAEVIILPGHRNKGLAGRLFKELEVWVIAQGYEYGCFVVEDHQSHPLKPENYKEHDPLWHSLGYQKTNIITKYEWNTVQPDGPSRTQMHELTYWAKKFIR